MPLTFSHPAAVLLLFRRPFVPAALVAGSMAPDMPYFLTEVVQADSPDDWYRYFVNATETHSWPGIVLYTLPLAGLMVLAWLVVRRPVLDLFGVSVERLRLRPAVVAWAVPSAFLGILTHVAWDALPFGRVGMVGGLPELVSAVGGLVSIALWLANRYRPQRSIRWTPLIGLGVFGACFAVLAVAREVVGGNGLSYAVRDSITIGAVAGAFGLLLWSVGWHVSHAASESRDSASRP